MLTSWTESRKGFRDWRWEVEGKEENFFKRKRIIDQTETFHDTV